MGLLERPGVARVPRGDAVVEARLHARPQAAQPRRVAGDAPLPVDLHDAAELPVGRGVEVVGGGPDGQRGAEGLVPAGVLRDAELRLAQRPLQRREEVRHRLRVVPDVRAGAVAAAPAVPAALPAPEAPVRLAHHGRGLQDREVGGHRLDDLGREGLVVEAVREAGGLLAQLGVAAPARTRPPPRSPRSASRTRGGSGAPPRARRPRGRRRPAGELVPTYHESWTVIAFVAPGARENGTNTVAPGEGGPSETGGRS